MRILKRLRKGIQKLTDELTKPESFAKGEDFEDYVRKFIFPKERYELIHKTHSYNENKKDYVKTSLDPDFGFRCNETKKDFFVEVKFNNGTYIGNKIEWCKPYQLERYKDIDKNQKPVFVCLGIGENPDKPVELFIIPLSKINFTGLYDSFLNEHSFYVGKPVFSNYLWNLEKRNG